MGAGAARSGGLWDACTRATVKRPLRGEFGLEWSGDGAQLCDLDPAEVLSEFTSAGALLFRSFQAGVEELRVFSDRFGAFRAHGGVFPPREDVDVRHGIQTVEAGSEPILPHSELRWAPFTPELVFFFCAVAPSRGGETTLYDGRQIYESLKAPLRSELEPRRLRYRHQSPPLYDWRKMLEVKTPEEGSNALQGMDNALYGAHHQHHFEGDVLHLDYEIPLFTRTLYSEAKAFASGLISGYGKTASFADGTPVPLSTRRELRFAAERVVVPVKWQAGDVVMLDNTRVMHGRRSFDAAVTRKIYTRFGRMRA